MAFNSKKLQSAIMAALTKTAASRVVAESENSFLNRTDKIFTSLWGGLKRAGVKRLGGGTATLMVKGVINATQAGTLGPNNVAISKSLPLVHKILTKAGFQFYKGTVFGESGVAWVKKTMVITMVTSTRQNYLSAYIAQTPNGLALNHPKLKLALSDEDPYLENQEDEIEDTAILTEILTAAGLDSSIIKYFYYQVGSTNGRGEAVWTADGDVIARAIGKKTKDFKNSALSMLKRKGWKPDRGSDGVTKGRSKFEIEFDPAGRQKSEVRIEHPSNSV
jgi:hypothetical protein